MPQEFYTKKLKNGEIQLYIDDQATGGRLESLIHNRKTDTSVSFKTNSNAEYAFKIEGLTSYWQNNKEAFTDIIISNLKYK